MKKEYIKPEVEIIVFDVEDVLLTSGTGVSFGDFLPGYGDDSDWL